MAALKFNDELARSLPVVRDQGGFAKKIRAGLKLANKALDKGLLVTPYFYEAVAYAAKAKKLQDASLAGAKVPKVGDPLMEAIPIYNTVERRFAGFSNVPELLWHGVNAPKFVNGQHANYPTPMPTWRNRVKDKNSHDTRRWMYLLLVHRITGSGASFEHDHGFRNNRVLHLGVQNLQMKLMADMLADHEAPIFTSLGNQIPPFPKMGGREYLRQIAPEFVARVHEVLTDMRRINDQPMGIKPAVDTVLSIHSSMGCKKFKFVLTAWVMDIAEYLPHLVDPTSDVYHGKNAMEAIDICFEDGKMTKQAKYDTATRIFAEATGTYPMDVEDAAPGCDFVRWIESYVPKKGFDHVIEKGIFNGSSLVWNQGRQPLPF